MFRKERARILETMLGRPSNLQPSGKLMSSVYVAILLLCAGAGLGVAAQTKPPKPRLSVRVIHAGAPETPTTSGLISVSNLRHIQLVITLAGPQLPPGVLSLKEHGTTPSAEPVVEISVTMIAPNGKTTVPIDTWVRGVGMRPGEQHLTVLIAIPDKMKRQQEIQEYLRRLEDLALKEGRAAEFDRLVKRNRTSTVAYYERLYVSNRIGDFEVVAQYSSNKPGAWTGTVTSEPVRLRVNFDGKFFDQPNFK